MATVPHHCLQEVTNALVSPSPTKKARNAVKILTFAVDHSPVQVELLSTHTIHDLVDIICRETLIGHQESVYDHMWNVVHVMNGEEYREEFVFNNIPPYEHKFANGERYESGNYACRSDLRAIEIQLDGLCPTSSLVLNYDYGDCFKYNIRLLGISSCQTGAAAFPRRRAAPMPADYLEYEPNTDTNALFPNLNEWTFPRS